MLHSRHPELEDNFIIFSRKVVNVKMKLLRYFAAVIIHTI